MRRGKRRIFWGFFGRARIKPVSLLCLRVAMHWSVSSISGCFFFTESHSGSAIVWFLIGKSKSQIPAWTPTKPNSRTSTTEPQLTPPRMAIPTTTFPTLCQTTRFLIISWLVSPQFLFSIRGATNIFISGQHSGLSANGPQCEAPSDLKKISTGDCWAHGVTSCLNVLRATFIAYDICYRLPMPIRSFVPAPPVLVSQCMACLPNNAHCRHEGNIYRRSEHRRGEYLAWEPCSGKNEGKAQPSCLPSQLVYVALPLPAQNKF